ncbi:hypothetical protein PF003_g35004 [Phytophthora fragariae]|nr:hypothetical protein PF003_g35004 [Phytophthora fragariae]
MEKRPAVEVTPAMDLVASLAVVEALLEVDNE